MKVQWERCDIRCGRLAVKFHSRPQTLPPEVWMIGYASKSTKDNQYSLVSQRDGMIMEPTSWDGIVDLLNKLELVPMEIIDANAPK